MNEGTFLNVITNDSTGAHNFNELCEQLFLLEVVNYCCQIFVIINNCSRAFHSWCYNITNQVQLINKGN